MKPRYLFLLAVLVTGSVTVAADTAPAAAPETPVVTAAMPKQGDITQSLKLPGTLIADEQVAIYAKVSGYLEELKVDRGDTVTKGQVIATLSAPEMQPELTLAEAKLRAAQSRIGRARSGAALEKTNSDRLKKLQAHEPGAVTQEDVETAAAKEAMSKAEVVTSEAESGVAAAEVARLKTMLGYLTLTAPMDGKVSERYADPGAFVSAGTGAKPVVEIVSTQHLRLTFDLPEKVAALVKVGQKLKYGLTALPGKSFEGSISRQAPALSADTRTLRSEVDLESPGDGLAAGMYATVQIPLAGLPGLSVVPASAIRTVEGKVCVLAVKDNAIAVVPVENLVDLGTDVVVLGTLSPETKLVTKGPATLQAGQQVKIAEGA